MTEVFVNGWPTRGLTLEKDVTSTVILGVDIGVHGALALLDKSGALLDVFDMPCLDDGPRRRRTINAPLFAELIYRTHAVRAYVERVGPRPGEGAVGAYAFGDCAGVVRGVLAAAAIPTRLIMPAQWKRIIGIPPGKEGAKDAARSAAIQRWPAQAGRFARVKDHGAAEAALIGLAGLLRFENAVAVTVPRASAAT